MKYLRRFNESITEDYEDYIYSVVGEEPISSCSGEKWYFAFYEKYIDYDFSKSKRFDDIKVIIEQDDQRIEGEEAAWVLLVDKKYYEDNYQYKVQNLNWEEHYLVKSLKSNMSTFDFGFNDAKVVKNLPRRCSLISGMNGYGRLEFWPQLEVEDPIYVSNNVELQHLIYKYICDKI